jgi:hypothetical protein
MLNNPFFQQMQQLLGGYLDDPYSMSPEDLANLETQLTNTANETYRNNLGQSLEQAGSVGAYRSGSTRNTEEKLARGLGSQVSEGMRSLRAQAAFQRPADISNALNAGMGMVSAPLQWNRDIANIYAGQATNPVYSQPSPFAQALGGIGSLGGSLVGASAMGSAVNGGSGMPFGISG